MTNESTKDEASTVLAAPVDELFMCGRCKDCTGRNENRYCTNGDAIDEDYGQGFNGNDDNLIYDYQEGGGFQVGDNFGCVHFKQK